MYMIRVFIYIEDNVSQLFTQPERLITIKNVLNLCFHLQIQDNVDN